MSTEATNAPNDRLRFDVAAWGLGLYAGARVIQIVLEAQSMAAAVGQAVLAEWGTSRLGVVWSPPDAPSSTAATFRRVGIGAAIGVGLAVLALVFPLATRSATVERVAGVELSVLGIGLLTAVLSAWRDELIQHGVVLRALPDAAPAPLRVVACGVVSAGAALGRSDATARAVFVAFLLGVVAGALWVKDRGAWQPWAATAATRFTIGTLLSGGVVQVRLVEDAWTGGSAGLLGGTAATLALAPPAIAAVVWAARRRISPPSARVG